MLTYCVNLSRLSLNIKALKTQKLSLAYKRSSPTNFLMGVQPVFILSKRLFLRDLCSILANTIITLDVSHLDKRNFQGNEMFDLDLQTTLTFSFSVKTQLVSRKLKILKLLMALYLY